VVGEDGEVARFQHMAEMLYGLVDASNLGRRRCNSVGPVEHFGEEDEGLPGFLDSF
jgi:hypothetical protein